jgi:hypothetical protein
MPTNRIGFSSDFVLTSSQVGIGTTNPRATLDVVGVLKGDFNISGVTTLTSYAGFIPQKQNIYFDTTVGIKTVGVGTFTQPYETETGNLELVGQFNTVSEDIIVDEGKIFEITTTNITGITTLGTQEVYAPDPSVVSVGTLESVSIQSHFSVPDGGISERVDNPIEGSVRFNDDLNTLEFYNGVEWRQFTVTGASGRGINAGGTLAPGLISNISYINISTQGNSLNFGNLSAGNELFGSCSSSTRGIFGGGRVPTYTNAIEYITIASEGNSINFGTLSTIGRLTDSLSSSTRGVFVCGFTPSAPLSGNTNTIDYIQISTLGNALDFGDASESKRVLGGFASSTRGVFAGGFISDSVKTIQYITFASTGNAIRFGDLTQEAYGNSGCSNSTRGLFGGLTSLNPGNVIHNIIEYVTIASTGNSTDFGDLTIARYSLSASSSQTRAVWCGGGALPAVTNVNTIDFVTIATTGNAIDFGDHLFTGRYGAGCSDSHGGLGGF